MVKKQVFIATRSKAKALREAEKKGLQHPIAVKVQGGYIVYEAYRRNPRRLRSRKRASPKQLAARAKFAAMVKARARKNPDDVIYRGVRIYREPANVDSKTGYSASKSRRVVWKITGSSGWFDRIGDAKRAVDHALPAHIHPKKNPLPMFPIYARKSSARPWSLLGVARQEGNARAIAALVHWHHGLAVKVDRE